MVTIFYVKPPLIDWVSGRSAHRGNVLPEPPPDGPFHDSSHGVVERVYRGARVVADGRIEPAPLLPVGVVGREVVCELVERRPLAVEDDDAPEPRPVYPLYTCPRPVKIKEQSASIPGLFSGFVFGRTPRRGQISAFLLIRSFPHSGQKFGNSATRYGCQFRHGHDLFSDFTVLHGTECFHQNRARVYGPFVLSGVPDALPAGGPDGSSLPDPFPATTFPAALPGRERFMLSSVI